MEEREREREVVELYERRYKIKWKNSVWAKENRGEEDNGRERREGGGNEAWRKGCGGKGRRKRMEKKKRRARTHNIKKGGKEGERGK